MSRFLKLAAASILVAGLAACTSGRDFAKPGENAFSLGRSTRTDIEAIYGKPFSEGSLTKLEGQEKVNSESASLFTSAPANGRFEKVSYRFRDHSKEIFTPGLTSAIREKTMTFFFYNTRLYSYLFTSNFEADPTNFDETKAGELKKGETTKSDAIQLFGTPSGKSVYPAISREGDEKFIYFYQVQKNGKLQSKILEIIFDRSGTASDFRLAEDSTPVQIYTPHGGATPIFIPRGK